MYFRDGTGEYFSSPDCPKPGIYSPFTVTGPVSNPKTEAQPTQSPF